MKTNINLLRFAEFILEWGIVHTKLAEKIKQILYI
jgi:hypothetical protein